MCPVEREREPSGCRASGLTPELPLHVVLVPPWLVPPLSWFRRCFVFRRWFNRCFVFRRWYRWCHVNRIAFAIFWIALGRFVLARCDGYKKAPELNKTHFRPNCSRRNWQLCINKLSLWYFQKERRRRIDSFEVWCWRRLLSIPWTARRTNKSVIEEIKATNPLETLIKKQQLSYFGHIMRSENSLEKSMMLGMGGGVRKRGRPRARWLYMTSRP